ncbi:hypothetical protein PDE01_18690 [Paracoccus denitrificans]|nr:hypothetical protein PDE01_18690 [Paracoccus denitrificans]
MPGPGLCPSKGRNGASRRKQGSPGTDGMTNQIALTLGLFILGLFAADALLLHWGLPVFLGKQFASLIEFLSFWR